MKWSRWVGKMRAWRCVRLLEKMSIETINNFCSPPRGTSMAASHIAGVAAWLAETNNPSSAGALETLIRSYFVPGSSPARVRLP
jgi:hypothetical protein